MGMITFKRIKMRKVEEPEEVKNVVVEEPEVVEQPVEEVAEEPVKRGSSRKK